MRDAFAHGALEVGADYEDVEARGAGYLVVQIVGGSLCEANAGVGCVSAIVDGKGSLLLGDIESHHRTELGDSMRHVLTVFSVCITHIARDPPRARWLSFA